jgi:hypothetical protein
MSALEQPNVCSGNYLITTLLKRDNINDPDGQTSTRFDAQNNLVQIMINDKWRWVLSFNFNLYDHSIDEVGVTQFK